MPKLINYVPQCELSSSIAFKKPMFKMFTQKCKVTAAQQNWLPRVRIHNEGNTQANIYQQQQNYVNKLIFNNTH